MAQFRVEFVLDQASGKYLAELYHPDRANELLVRTKPVYRTPQAAVLGVVQLFKGTIPQGPKKKKRKMALKAKKPKLKAKKPKLKARKPKRKQTSKRRR